MAAKRTPYLLKDGSEVPGVTTVIGNRVDPGGLMWWSWDQGRQGLAYKETLDKAAAAGTLAHAAVEAWIRKRPFEWTGEDEIQAKAKKAYGAFLEWADMTSLHVTDAEVRLVSEVYRFGGTMDGVTVRGRRSVLDWKSTSGTYVDHLIQVRAYVELWNENHPDDPVTEGMHLVRFDKEYGDFHHHWWPEADDAWEQFTLLRRAYDLDKRIKARVR